MLTNLIKHIRYILEALLVLIMFGVFRLSTLDGASAVGGWIGRSFGRFHKTDKTARNNLRRVMPELSEEDINRIVLGMWDNLGRTVAEYPYLGTDKLLSRIENIGDQEHLKQAYDSDRTALMIGGHNANWELPPFAAYGRGYPVSLIYRHANNPIVEWLIYRLRKGYTKDLFPKGSAGAKGIVKAIKAGDNIALLLDQKMNDGIAIPFFGIDAMTAPAAANLVIKYQLPIYFGVAMRNGGANFQNSLEPLTFELSGDNKKDIVTIMTAINQRLEQWIRKNPEQWFWVHNRWPKENSEKD